MEKKSGERENCGSERGITYRGRALLPVPLRRQEHLMSRQE